MKTSTGVHNDLIVSLIVAYLSKRKEELKNYLWDDKWGKLFPIAKAFSKLPLPDFVGSMPSYDRNILMRPFVSSLLKEVMASRKQENFEKVRRWIVSDWGGINRGKLEPTLENFLNVNPNLPFERIASHSKVLSFWEPDQYAVYDARVAYSLNWILLSNGVKKDFFPVPEGRNTRMKGFDIEVLIRLNFASHYDESGNPKRPQKFVSQQDKRLFLENDEAYSVYCPLLSKVAEELWKGEDHRLLKTEMLLFTIADTVVFSEIVKRTKISIAPEKA